MLKSPPFHNRNNGRNNSNFGSPNFNNTIQNTIFPIKDEEYIMEIGHPDEFHSMYNHDQNHEQINLTTMFQPPNDKVNQSYSQAPSMFRNNSAMNSPLIPRDIPAIPQHVYNTGKVSEEVPEVNEEPVCKTGGKRKFNKGLKLLSVIVKDIVVEKKATTYKEVADIILRDTIKFENLNLNHKIEIAKEEQNIKRRVYDALNVLISAGILIKEGKLVRKNKNNKEIIVNLKRLGVQTLSSKIVE